MPYTSPPGGSVTLIFRSPYSKPPGGSVTLEFAPPAGQTISTPSIGDTSAFGVPVMLWTQFIATNGIPAGDFGSNTEVDYRRLKPEGFGGEVFGAVALKWTQFIEPLGIEADAPSSQFAVSNFSGQYVIPSAVEVVLRFGPLVSTTSASAFPVEFHYPPNSISPLAWSSSRFGALYAFIPGAPQHIYPVGYNASVLGNATVYESTQYVLPGGVAPNPQTGPNSAREVPSPTIDYRNKYLLPVGIAPPTNQIPTHYVAGYFQFIDQAGRGSGPETFGTALAAYKIRTLYPSFIVSDSYGTPLVGRARNVYPTGFGGGTIPITHTVEDYSNRIAPHTGSADPVSYGVAGVRNAKLFVYPNTSAWIADQVNFPILYNKKQVLLVRQFQDTDAEVAKYGLATIENRNRTLHTFGHSDSRFSYYAADVYNKAMAVAPPGLDATLFGTTLVAYRIRNVYPGGFDSFYTQQPGTIVYNSARVVAPFGIRADAVPTALVFNRNRTVSQYFPYGGESFGTPFVAYRVRSLVQQPFNDVPASLPEVRFNPYPVAPTGIDSYATGGAFVYIHRNEVFPRSTNVRPTDAVGEAYVQNRNKTIAPYAYEQTTFGLTSVENYIRNVRPDALPTTVFGPTDISRRTKLLSPQPFSSHVTSVFAQIRNVIPDPPGQQNIIAYGMAPDTSAVPPPSLRYQTIFPTSISPPTASIPAVRDTNLHPVWTFDDYVGTPRIIATQYIYPKYIPSQASPGVGESDLFGTKPRVTPHTIYAPSADQATDQAKQNNGFDAEIIDRSLWNTPPYHFGVAIVSNKNRTITQYRNPGVDTPETTYGTPSVTLRTRRVYPIGSRFVRFGYHRLNGAQEILANGFEVTHDFGAASVNNAYTSPYVYASGLDAADYGRPDVTNYNRTLLPTGYEQTSFGTASVHPPVRLEMVGFVATRWGDTMVSYRNRFVHPQGYYAFLSSDHLPGFNDRMRVRLATPTPPTPTYTP